VAVTKNASIAQVRELLEMGHADFGESRMQHFLQFAAQVDDFLERHHELGPSESQVPEAIRWHFIGHLQRNKVRKILAATRLIHSVDSLRLAEEIQACPLPREEATEVLIQVNVSGERGKNGIAPAAAMHLIEQMDTMADIKVRGLMCMAPYSENPEESRSVFERARELYEELKTTKATGDCFRILSMGMSNDYEVAIECGANVVRVGSAIFGPPSEQENPSVAVTEGGA
jgi:pyridoxal phosphate enzyme (YggS family)